MKKLVVLLTIVAVLVCSVLSVSAATAQEQVIDALKAIPATKNGNVVAKTEIALKKVNPTDAQCAQIVTWLGELKTAFPTDKGPKASAYTAAEKQAVLDFIDKVAKLLDAIPSMSVLAQKIYEPVVMLMLTINHMNNRLLR